MGNSCGRERGPTLAYEERVRKLDTPGSVRIFVRMLTGETLSLDVELSDTIEFTRLRVEQKTQVAPSAQELVFETRRLRSETATLDEEGIVPDSTLQLIIVAQREAIVRQDTTSNDEAIARMLQEQGSSDVNLGWICPQCTLRNQLAQPKCSLCDAPGPTSGEWA